MRTKLDLWPVADAQAAKDASLDVEGKTLRDFLVAHPCLSLAPVAEHLDTPLERLRIQVLTEVDPTTPLYRPPGIVLAAAAADIPATGPAATTEPATTSTVEPPAAPEPEASPGDEHPDHLTEAQAVVRAHAHEIEQIATFLRAGLSVLTYCDKLIVEPLARRIVAVARLEAKMLQAQPDDEGGSPLQGGGRQKQLARLRQLLDALKPGQALVIPHLDLMGASGERSLAGDAKELTELLYAQPDRVVLAFADRTLPLPEVIAARFAVRPTLAGLPRDVPGKDGKPVPVAQALVTRSEARWFSRFPPAEMFKNVAGLNPVRLRHAMAYAVEKAREKGFDPERERPAPFEKLVEWIRAFKAQTSEEFSVPDVTMTDIGGYPEVKATLGKALQLMRGAWTLPDERLRRELVPRGFLLYGPPGTGKTLFAKAVANMLDATIRIVSGPEVTDKYVGESERKVREIFAEARRNAPSVIVFDEFDSIAAQRSGRDDGGSRAGNALVAQILTEMDGFRPDVPMLVIGTTNRLELIDEALLRPSRFQPVGVHLPDTEARRSIAEIHAKHFRVELPPDERDEILSLVALSTYGMNGDEIRSIFRDACMGAYCGAELVPPTAERMGFLVGQLRKQVEQRRFERERNQATRAYTRGPRAGGEASSLADAGATTSPRTPGRSRPGPTGEMFPAPLSQPTPTEPTGDAR